MITYLVKKCLYLMTWLLTLSNPAILRYNPAVGTALVAATKSVYRSRWAAVAAAAASSTSLSLSLSLSLPLPLPLALSSTAAKSFFSCTSWLKLRTPRAVGSWKGPLTTLIYTRPGDQRWQGDGDGGDGLQPCTRRSARAAHRQQQNAPLITQGSNTRQRVSERQ